MSAPLRLTDITLFWYSKHHPIIPQLYPVCNHQKNLERRDVVGAPRVFCGQSFWDQLISTPGRLSLVGHSKFVAWGNAFSFAAQSLSSWQILILKDVTHAYDAMNRWIQHIESFTETGLWRAWWTWSQASFICETVLRREGLFMQQSWRRSESFESKQGQQNRGSGWCWWTRPPPAYCPRNTVHEDSPQDE